MIDQTAASARPNSILRGNLCGGAAKLLLPINRPRLIRVSREFARVKQTFDGHCKLAAPSRRAQFRRSSCQSLRYQRRTLNVTQELQSMRTRRWFRLLLGELLGPGNIKIYDGALILPESFSRVEIMSQAIRVDCRPTLNAA